MVGHWVHYIGRTAHSGGRCGSLERLGLQPGRWFLAVGQHKDAGRGLDGSELRAVGDLRRGHCDEIILLKGLTMKPQTEAVLYIVKLALIAIMSGTVVYGLITYLGINWTVIIGLGLLLVYLTIQIYETKVAEIQRRNSQ